MLLGYFFGQFLLKNGLPGNANAYNGGFFCGVLLQ
jgi:hypothetical protein